MALSDGSGNVTDAYAYEPFGNTTVQGSSHNPFRFVGQYGVMDDGNGLHHMRARYYRPDLRRFVSLDALYGEVNDPMTLNRYQYVSGNPMVGMDPSGKITEISYEAFNTYLGDRPCLDKSERDGVFGVTSALLEASSRGQLYKIEEWIYWREIRKILKKQGEKLSDGMELQIIQGCRNVHQGVRG